jgi:hypothetical protein
MGTLSNIDRSAIVGKVRKHYAKVDKSSENTGAKTANRCWSDLSEIDRTYDNGLANAQACDEPSCIYGAEVTAVAHEDSDANNPEYTQLASCPNTTNTIANDECTKSSILACTLDGIE